MTFKLNILTRAISATLSLGLSSLYACNSESSSGAQSGDAAVTAGTISNGMPPSLKATSGTQSTTTAPAKQVGTDLSGLLQAGYHITLRIDGDAGFLMSQI